MSSQKYYENSLERSRKEAQHDETYYSAISVTTKLTKLKDTWVSEARWLGKRTTKAAAPLDLRPTLPLGP